MTNLRPVPPATPDLFPTEPALPTPPPEPPQQVIIQRTGIPEALVAAFAALGYALSARLILTLSLIGAFALGVMAMRTNTILSMCILIAYCALTVIPSAALEIFGKRPIGDDA